MKNRKFKKGAASFYIVAFATLILMILATSFAAVIISEVTRTSNDDLSQSAYDSAMAGVEDARLAYYSYRNCIANGAEASGSESSGNDTDCANIMKYMKDPDEAGCNMVGKMLGRENNEEKPVVIEESNTSGNGGVSNNMQQAYTCVKIKNVLEDYEASVSKMDVVNVKFTEDVNYSEISKVKVSWGDPTKEGGSWSQVGESSDLKFDESQKVPPVIYIGMIQTAENFKLSEFEMSQGDRTNRGMVYLVPSNEPKVRTKNENGYIGAWDSGKNRNIIGQSGFVNSNKKTAKTGDKATNRPYLIYCDLKTTESYLCNTEIEIPKPIGDGGRSEETFTFIIGLPYGGPETDVSLQFFCNNGSACGDSTSNEGSGGDNIAMLQDVQVEVDSTGKANDIFRRVRVRLSNSDDSMLSVMGPLEFISGAGESGNNGLLKGFEVDCEHNFDGESNCKDGE